MFSKKPLKSNYDDRTRLLEQIKYIVIHFTANDGDTARNNLNYFASNTVKASAHFFVDEMEVCASVPVENIAWHCGGKKYFGVSPLFYGVCYNSNSIGVELCSRQFEDGKFYFLDRTVENAARLVADLMEKYNVPIDRVIRHYDVVGKNCPAPFVDKDEWANFLKLVEYYRKGDEPLMYEKLEQIPAGELRDTVAECVEKGIIKGTGEGLHLTMEMIRCLVFCKRMIDRKEV